MTGSNLVSQVRILGIILGIFQFAMNKVLYQTRKQLSACACIVYDGHFYWRTTTGNI